MIEALSSYQQRNNQQLDQLLPQPWSVFTPIR
ncbi:Uncharacterised protein [Vibrio cholerae]|nr:Uncharacterised protein [Vibrio cholerae]